MFIQILFIYTDRNYKWIQSKAIIERPCSRGRKRRAIQFKVGSKEPKYKKRRLVAENTSLVSELQTELEQLKREKQTLDNKSHAQESEINNLKRQIESYVDLYDAPITDTVILDHKERDVFKNFLDFVNAYAAMPQSTASKIRILKKKEEIIKQYIENSKALQKRCKYEEH